MSESKKLNVVIGNTYKECSDGQSFDWTVYVRAESDDVSLDDHISNVQFQLHPTFKKNKINVKKGPFEFSTRGWGTFDIGVVISLYGDDTDYEFTHELSFEGDDEDNLTVESLPLSGGGSSETPEELLSDLVSNIKIGDSSDAPISPMRAPVHPMPTIIKKMPRKRLDDDDDILKPNPEVLRKPNYRIDGAPRGGGGGGCGEISPMPARLEEPNFNEISPMPMPGPEISPMPMLAPDFEPHEISPMPSDMGPVSPMPSGPIIRQKRPQ